MRPLERCLVSGAGANLGDDSVPAQGQIGAQDEGGAPPLDPVDLPGHGPVLGLGQLADLAVLEFDPNPHLGAVGHVDGDSGLHAAACDHGGGERLTPGGILDPPQGLFDLLVGTRPHAECGEHGLEGGA